MAISRSSDGDHPQASLPHPNPSHSYWHSQPNEKLIGRRSTDHVPTKADVVVVGAGICGVRALWELMGMDDADDVDLTDGKGLDVVLLEAREVCWGATGRNGGHCQPLLYEKPPHIGRFEIRNFEHVQSLVNKYSIDCDWKVAPSCHAFYSAEAWAKAVAAVTNIKATAPDLGKNLTLINPESTNPSLKDLRVPTAVGAVRTAFAGSLWPYKFVCALLEKMLEKYEVSSSSDVSSKAESGKKTLNLQTKTPVTSLQSLDDGTWIVHTERGMIATPKVLLTTNGYTSHLIPSFSSLIVPVQGEMSALAPPPSLHPSRKSAYVPNGLYDRLSAMRDIMPPAPKASSGPGWDRKEIQNTLSAMGVANPPSEEPIQDRLHATYGFGGSQNDPDREDYLIQLPFITSTSGLSGGELMFGGGRSFATNGGVGTTDDSAINPAAAQYLRQILPQHLSLPKSEIGENGELKPLAQWTGILGYSRDQWPWVGEVPGKKGVWISAGFHGHGMPNTTLCGKAVARLMMGAKKDDVDLPNEFHLTEDRVKEALKKPSVKEMYGEGQGNLVYP